MYENMDCLIGKKVLKIYMNEENLKFETDKGNIVFEVEGDCCSCSVFYDFIGVKKLLTKEDIQKIKELAEEISFGLNGTKYTSIQKFLCAKYLINAGWKKEGKDG